MAKKRDIKKITQESGFYEPYSHFSRTLRAWLVAYGIGGPVLIASQDSLSKAILESGSGNSITVLFLAGVSVQVFAALLYKYSMGIIYASELDPTIEDSFPFKVADWISEAFLLEFVFDLVSIVCFVIATYNVLSAAIF